MDKSPSSATKSVPDESVKESSSGIRREIKTVKPLDESHLERFPALSTSMDQPCCEDKLSSLLEVKSSNYSSQLGAILPANLSCLTPCMDMKKLKRSTDLMVNEKKLSITGRGKMHYQNHDVIDLTGDLLSDRQQIKEKQLAPCPMKKRKVLLKEYDALQHVKSSNDYASDAQRSGPSNLAFIVSPVKHKNLQISDARSVMNAKNHLLHKDDGAADVDAKFLDHKSKGVHSSTELHGAKETKGSAFLVQVKEKLSPAEYEEFVGLMKAMKSKVMKISNVLQCIVGLFSGPERLPLLERFKDYVPAKYHSLYEQYSKEMRDDQRS